MSKTRSKSRRLQAGAAHYHREKSDKYHDENLVLKARCKELEARLDGMKEAQLSQEDLTAAVEATKAAMDSLCGLAGIPTYDELLRALEDLPQLRTALREASQELLNARRTVEVLQDEVALKRACEDELVTLKARLGELVNGG